MKKVLFIFLLVLGILPSSNAQLAGSLDSTFNQTGYWHNAVDSANSKTGFVRIRTDNEGKIYTFGFANAYNFFRPLITRFNNDGTLDPSFAGDGILYVDYTLSVCMDGFVLPDGKILAVTLEYYNDYFDLIRLLPDGTPDATYGPNGIRVLNPGVVLKSITDATLLPDGGMIVTGTYADNYAAPQKGSFVSRVKADGTMDTSFGNAGTVKLPPSSPTGVLLLYGSDVQEDGKIIVCGNIASDISDYSWYASRLMPDGTPDPSFGTNGVFTKNFGTQYAESANSVIVLSDGKILVGGAAEKGFGPQFTVLRLKTNGTLDNSFGFAGKAQVSVTCCKSAIFNMELQADGKIVACGWGSEADERVLLAVARFKPNGLVDQTFGTGGAKTFDFQQNPTENLAQRASAVVIQSDQKILVGGSSERSGAFYAGILLRLNPGAAVGTQNLAETIQNLELAPNPVTDEAFTLRYSLTEPAQVTIALYDLLGRSISNLQQDEMRQGGEQAEKLFLPAGLAPGQYLLRLETAQGTKAIKLLKSE
jgi:uncharacterized delta-60 repeat protein